VAKSFLGYTEHLPDAHRGWDLPPALLVHLIEDMDTGLHPRKGHPPRIYSSAILLDLASPDFSMPYNVIILTCSLMAFVFGSVFNLLNRKFSVIALDNEAKGL
jgi:phosphatidylinositol glycan class T